MTTAVLIGGTAISQAAPASPPTGEAEAAIDAGRLLAMLEQISTLLKAEPADQESEDGAAAQLTAAVHRYNVLHGVACETNVIMAAQCRDADLPAPPENPSAKILRSELEKAEARIRPFWESVCQKLDNPVHPICQME